MEGTLNTQEILQKWLSHNKKYLESVSQKKLLVTFSGGKDSSACLYLLNKVKEQFNFKISGKKSFLIYSVSAKNLFTV
jgi:tRNA(Ile)-lysidine synthase TilS/MesJ